MKRINIRRHTLKLDVVYMYVHKPQILKKNYYTIFELFQSDVACCAVVGLRTLIGQLPVSICQH